MIKYHTPYYVFDTIIMSLFVDSTCEGHVEQAVQYYCLSAEFFELFKKKKNFVYFKLIPIYY